MFIVSIAQNTCFQKLGNQSQTTKLFIIQECSDDDRPISYS